jgi:hypothetical protein
LALRLIIVYHDQFSLFWRFLSSNIAIMLTATRICQHIRPRRPKAASRNRTVAKRIRPTGMIPFHFADWQDVPGFQASWDKSPSSGGAFATAEVSRLRWNFEATAKSESTFQCETVAQTRAWRCGRAAPVFLAAAKCQHGEGAKTRQKRIGQHFLFGNVSVYYISVFEIGH